MTQGETTKMHMSKSRQYLRQNDPLHSFNLSTLVSLRGPKLSWKFCSTKFNALYFDFSASMMMRFAEAATGFCHATDSLMTAQIIELKSRLLAKKTSSSIATMTTTCCAWSCCCASALFMLFFYVRCDADKLIIVLLLCTWKPIVVASDSVTRKWCTSGSDDSIT